MKQRSRSATASISREKEESHCSYKTPRVLQLPSTDRSKLLIDGQSPIMFSNSAKPSNEKIQYEVYEEDYDQP